MMVSIYYLRLNRRELFHESTHEQAKAHGEPGIEQKSREVSVNKGEASV